MCHRTRLRVGASGIRDQLGLTAKRPHRRIGQTSPLAVERATTSWEGASSCQVVRHERTAWFVMPPCSSPLSVGPSPQPRQRHRPPSPFLTKAKVLPIGDPICATRSGPLTSIGRPGIIRCGPLIQKRFRCSVILLSIGTMECGGVPSPSSADTATIMRLSSPSSSRLLMIKRRLSGSRLCWR